MAVTPHCVWRCGGAEGRNALSVEMTGRRVGRRAVAPRALSALSHGKKRHKDASAVRLELTQAEPIAFRVQPLNRSGTLTI